MKLTSISGNRHCCCSSVVLLGSQNETRGTTDPRGEVYCGEGGACPTVKGKRKGE